MIKLFNHLAAAAVLAASGGTAQAAPITIQLDFDGLGVTTSSDPVVSTPITFDVVVDDEADDTDSSPTRGVFAITSLTATSDALGIDGEEVVDSDLRLVVFSNGLAINGGPGSLTGFDIGFNGNPLVSAIIGDVNDLSTLIQPASFSGSDVFSSGELTFANSTPVRTDTSGGSVSVRASAVDEPAIAGLLGLGALGLMWSRRRGTRRPAGQGR